MSSLRLRERKVLEDFLEMGGGYVLNFSNPSFVAFFRDFGIDIDASPYVDGRSGSKANRMRSFFAHARDKSVGEIISELIEYAELYRPGHPQTDACRKIAARLLESSRLEEVHPQAHARPDDLTSLFRTTAQPIEIFFSYAHEDEALMDTVRLQLVVRERIGQIVKWHDRMIPGGDEWRHRIDERIHTAHVILLFMSPHFLASRYCYEIEGQIALQRNKLGSARVIPVILRACDWTITPFGELQGLPRDGVPLAQRNDRDQASLEIARGIMDSIR
jgi:hypothetical protein